MFQRLKIYPYYGGRIGETPLLISFQHRRRYCCSGGIAACLLSNTDYDAVSPLIIR